MSSSPTPVITSVSVSNAIDQNQTVYANWKMSDDSATPAPFFISIVQGANGEKGVRNFSATSNEGTFPIPAGTLQAGQDYKLVAFYLDGGPPPIRSNLVPLIIEAPKGLSASWSKSD